MLWLRCQPQVVEMRQGEMEIGRLLLHFLQLEFLEQSSDVIVVRGQEIRRRGDQPTRRALLSMNGSYASSLNSR